MPRAALLLCVLLACDEPPARPARPERSEANRSAVGSFGDDMRVIELPAEPPAAAPPTVTPATP